MALEKTAAVLRVYLAMSVNEANKATAESEHKKMCAAAEYLLSFGIIVYFSVVVGLHPDADRWNTADVLKKHFAVNPAVRVIEVEGDPFYSALNVLVEPLHLEGFEQMLSVSYTSVQLLTPLVIGAIGRAFHYGALTVAVVPPDMPTGLRGAANNQCMAWNIHHLMMFGGFDSRDVKPPDFNMERDIQGVGEIIPALKMGRRTMAVIIPNVDKGDTRETSAQEAKRKNKERRINAWLAGYATWEDLEALIIKGYPLDLRSR